MKIENLFVPYKIAKIAKEKNFDECCMARYEVDDKSLHIKYDNEPLIEEQQKRPKLFSKTWENSSLPQYLISAPTYQQLIDWFREKHNIIISIQLDQTSTIKWAYDIVKWNGFADFERKTNLYEWGLYRDYYDCINHALEESFELI